MGGSDKGEEGGSERVSYSLKHYATHISSSLVLEGTVIDQSVHALNPLIPSHTNYILRSSVQDVAEKPTASASSHTNT